MGKIKPYQAYLVKTVSLDLLPLWYLQALLMPTFVVFHQSIHMSLLSDHLNVICSQGNIFFFKL